MIQGTAWRMLLETHRDLVHYLEQQFREELGVDLRYYDIMLHVSEAEGGRRMTDLAEAVVVSKSGLTSQVDRMEKDGLIARTPDPEDRRAIRIVLSPAGERLFREVSRKHSENVQRIFYSRVSDEEAQVIVDVLSRLEEAIRE